MSVWNGSHRSFCHSAGSAAGFSAIELLVALVLMAMSVSLALPSLKQGSAHNQVQAASNSIVSGLNMARFNAIKTGAETTICSTADGSSCSDDSWADGWIVFVDEDNDAVADNSELVRIVMIEGNILASGLEKAITFESDGSTTRDSDTIITSCYQQTSISGKCVSITINPPGGIVSAETRAIGQ